MKGFHFMFAADPDPAFTAPFRDYVLATPGQYVVTQNPPTPLGAPTTVDKWCPIVRPEWDFDVSESDLAAASLFADRIDALTATGQIVIVDEISGGGWIHDSMLGMLGLTIRSLAHPAQVYFAIVPGANVSYENLDAAHDFPVISDALEMGCGLLPELYVPQPKAELSGNVDAYIDRYFRGPGDGRLPYLLARKRELGSTSPIHAVFPVIDRFFKGERRQRLKRARFLDICMQRLWLRYPSVAAEGIGTWVWDSTRMTDPTRPADLAALIAHWSPDGLGGQSGGRSRFYTTAPVAVPA